MTVSGGENTGLLLAMMEPSPTFEEEFQDWYDIEHFPERSALDGFLTASRLVCLDGWPRYLALYDLKHVDVLRGDGYGKIAGGNYSRWTNRVVPRMWGHYRAEGTQIYPNAALFGANGQAARIMLWRFRKVPPAIEAAVVEGMRAMYEGKPETAQLRVFHSPQERHTDCLAIVELHVPFMPEPGSARVLGDALRHVDMVNSYTCYNRRWS